MRFSAAIMAGCVLALANGERLATAEVPAQGAEAKLSRITLRVSVLPNDPFDQGQKLGSPMKVRRGQVVKLVVEGELKPGYHTYPLVTDQTERWKMDRGQVEGVEFLGQVKETPEPEKIEVKGQPPLLGHHKGFTWSQDMLVSANAKPGPLELPIKLRGTVCDERNCLPVKADLKASLDVSADEALPVDPKLEKPPIAVQPPSSPVKVAGPAAASEPRNESVFSLISSSKEQYEQEMADLAAKITSNGGGPQVTATSDLGAFILAGIFWGAISLVTPCVFPMIPITVSIFLKQSEKEHHRPVVMALVYSGTIIVVLTLAAAFMLSVFRWLSVNPIMNYALGALFVFFSLSLFGMYDIELPSGLARYTSSHESEGGYFGIVFMALTFTIISFACVAPFLGGFGGTAAGTARPMWHNLLGGLAFSITFAAPFFFLALFPTLLRKMPKSGSWLNSVKVIMGFLELAAAVKFCRSAELVLTGSDPWLITFDFALGIYVALSLFCGLYLLGIFRLPHDTPEEHLGVPRMVFAGMFVALALYLLPALFKDAHGDNLRPRGTVYSWVESFLLPDSLNSAKEGPHTANLPAAVAQAREQFNKQGTPQRIFVDFTGVTCTNCKINEKSVFSKPDFERLFKAYTVVKLFTDTVPTGYYSPALRARFGSSQTRQLADADINLGFQQKIFGTEQLPLYAILEPQRDGTVRVIQVYDEGRINNEDAFAEFLRDPQ